ncbi:MAG: FHA domain-containing protein, partial [Planctomycetota bacterium]
MARFILDENQRRTVHDLDGEVVRVGRAQDNDIAVLDLRASRHHCVVERHGEDQYVLVDLGSQNGTRLNGQLVDRASLHPGDRIGVGGATVWFGNAPPPDAALPD